MRRRPFSQYPICDGGIGPVIGCVTFKDLMGGFIVHRMRRAARKGDKVEAAGFVFEVVDADKMRLNWSARPASR